MEISKPEGALSGGAPTPTLGHGQQLVVEIPVQRIERNPQQPRVEFGEAELEELAASMRQHGVLQPLLVVRKPLEAGQPERFELVAGERRWRAAQRAGLATVPCIIHDDLTERDRLEISIIENIQRKDLNEIEEATAYQRLHVEFGLSHEAIAQRVGKARPTVSNLIRLLDLPEKMRQALIGKKISYGQARALLMVTDPVQREGIFDQCLKGEMSARALERLMKGKKPRKKPRHEDAQLLNMERELSRVLGAPVRIKAIGPGGVIEVDFFSGAELSGIVRRIAKDESV